MRNSLIINEGIFLYKFKYQIFRGRKIISGGSEILFRGKYVPFAVIINVYQDRKACLNLHILFLEVQKFHLNFQIFNIKARKNNLNPSKFKFFSCNNLKR
jgi:hypothetical protein